ncbi:MAG: mannose-1-phosphate guanylyltransferase [Halobacteriaceae archaeon]
MTTENPIVAVLLAGGQGRRLYPASRSDRPKQFFAPDGGRSLLRRTADRAQFADAVYAVTPPTYAEAVQNTVPEAGLIVEPAARDTGPALVYAAHRIREQVGASTLVCMPTDHYVDGEPVPTLERAASIAAEHQRLVTVGIEPERPATGYGYIEPGATLSNGAAASIQSFHEKPDATTAARYVDAGYLWNTGIFAWQPSVLLRAAAESPLSGLVDALGTPDVERAYRGAPAANIDSVLLEDCSSLAVVRAEFTWDDVGTWDAVGRVYGTELAPSSCRIDSPGTIVASDGPHVSVIGMENTVVAAYGDHVLVAPREESQRVREIANAVDVDTVETEGLDDR